MKKIYFLASCDTCQKIIKDSGLDKKGFVFQNIKTERISPDQLDEMKNLIGCYEALFNRKALKYRSLGLKDKKLTEKDYRQLILSEYTFLKRPVVISGKRIFAGNEKKTIAALKAATLE